MGTFHQGKGELHGITVVVDTHGEEIYIGRCDTMDEEGILLQDVDVRREGEDGRTKEEHARHAAKLGFWKQMDRLRIPSDQIASVRRLGEIASS